MELSFEYGAPDTAKQTEENEGATTVHNYLDQILQPFPRTRRARRAWQLGGDAGKEGGSRILITGWAGKPCPAPAPDLETHWKAEARRWEEGGVAL